MTDNDKYFAYLDRLRESGITNMWGATDYIMKEFGLDYIESRDILVTWMETFSERHAKNAD